MMLVLYGPTVTGKTNLAINLAKKFNAQLISADSRQIYRGLDIGTGKISPNSKVIKHEGNWIVNGINIYGFDLANPEQKFSVADFIKFSDHTIKQIIKSKHTPIVVGGTGFYIKSLLEGINSIGILPNKKLRKKLEELSAIDLYQKLHELNPRRALSMNQSDRANPRRLIRAIEIAVYKNNQLSSNHPTIQPSNYLSNYLIIGLTAPNEFLYKRADAWLNERLEMGMVNEVKSLIEEGVDPNWLESLGLEYRWITKFILGQIIFDEAFQRLKGDIHDFIRRQKTFFKQFDNIMLYDISQKNWQNELEKMVLS